MTFTISVQLLCGRYSATSATNRQQAEWPPHPDRFFQALVDAHYNPDEGVPAPEERTTLEWLEGLTPPRVICSSAAERAVLTHFVPVNDVRPAKLKENESLKNVVKKTKAGLELLVETRLKQPRFFPTIVPEHPFFYFQWDAEPTGEYRHALQALLRRVVRIGHSSSFVQCSLVDEIAWPEELAQFCFLPTERGGDISLRTPSTGRLEALDHAHDNRLYPSLLRGTGYALEQTSDSPAVPHSQYEPSILVLRATRMRGATYPLTQTLRWTAALRGAILSKGGANLSPEASGHDARGEKMLREHLAIVPLAHVDSRHADGHLMGFGIVLPRGARGVDNEILDLLNKPVTLPRGWILEYQQQYRTLPPRSLRPTTYTGGDKGAETWVSITPVVLDHHLKTRVRDSLTSEERAKALQLQEDEIIESIRRSIAITGLPTPLISVAQTPFLRGVPHVSEFPRDRRGKLCRFHTHVKLVFPVPVAGPILLGSARYRGYGLLKPVREEKLVYSDCWCAQVDNPAEFRASSADIREWLSLSGRPEPRTISIQDQDGVVHIQVQFFGLVKGPLRWRGAGASSRIDFKPVREHDQDGGEQ